jgi:hypothetical protein
VIHSGSTAEFQAAPAAPLAQTQAAEAMSIVGGEEASSDCSVAGGDISAIGGAHSCPPHISSDQSGSGSGAAATAMVLVAAGKQAEAVDPNSFNNTSQLPAEIPAAKSSSQGTGGFIGADRATATAAGPACDLDGADKKGGDGCEGHLQQWPILT